MDHAHKRPSPNHPLNPCERWGKVLPRLMPRPLVLVNLGKACIKQYNGIRSFLFAASRAFKPVGRLQRSWSARQPKPATLYARSAHHGTQRHDVRMQSIAPRITGTAKSVCCMGTPLKCSGLFSANCSRQSSRSRLQWPQTPTQPYSFIGRK